MIHAAGMKRVSGLLRNPTLFLLTLLGLSAVLGGLRFNSFQVGSFNDDANYIVLAESLASGQGYREINFPCPQAEWAFPPGWPLLLAPLAGLFPGNYAVLKLFTLLLWLASIVLIYRLFSGRLQPPYLNLFMLVAAASPALVGASVMVMSEIPYLFFTLLALNLFTAWEKSQGRRRGYVLVIVLAFTAWYAQLIRTVGLALVLAIFVSMLRARRYRQAGLLAGLIAAGLAVQLWLNSPGGGSVISAGYESQVFGAPLIEKLGHIRSNILGYLDETAANALVPVFGPRLDALAGRFGAGFIPQVVNLAVLVLLGAGFLLSIRQLWVGDLYVLFYVPAILTFWVPIFGGWGERFLIPILPFLFYYLLRALTWFAGRLAGRRLSGEPRPGGPWILTGLIAALVVLLLLRNIQAWRNPIRDRIADLSVGTGWVSANAPADAILMAREPVPIYLYARRKTVPYPSPADSIDDYINGNSVDYILISPELAASERNRRVITPALLLPVLADHPDEYRPVYQDTARGVTVFEVTGSENQAHKPCQ